MLPHGRILAPLVILLAAIPVRAVAQETADMIVTHAVIHTLDPATPEAEAMAVRDGAVVGVGASADVVAGLGGPDTEVIDAGGRTVIPGLIDAHAHVLSLGQALRTLDLVGTESAERIADMVRAEAARRKPGEWILGRGWDQNDWEVEEFPGHALLDAAAPDNPVYLTRVDGHAGWANARAMEEAGVTDYTQDPEGGRIVREPGGALTGVFVDNAQGLVRRAIPGADRAELAARLEAAQERMVEVGLTGAYDMGIERATVELYRDWAADGRLKPRIVAYLSDDSALLDWWRDEGKAATPPTNRFRIVGLKMYADGALGSRGAALLAPYDDDPGNTGLLVTEPETMARDLARGLTLGLQPAIHAIGDRGNRLALDAIEYGWRTVASKGSDGLPGYDGWEGLNPRIEHAQVVALEDIPRFAALGVIASMQPTHATSDMYWAEDRIGPERIQGAYAWRKMRDAGVPLACGSDFPVESPNPFFGLYAAITRQDQKGWPPGGWYPEERMTREEALRCFTVDAAASVGMDGLVGSLSPGKRADFLIVDTDPLTAPASEIWKTKVLRTVIDGETVYRAAP